MNETETVMTPSDVEAIERATVAAVSPERLEALEGWLLPIDSGTVGRAKSAVPLRHAAVAAGDGLVARIEARYEAHGLPAVFRLATAACFDGLRAELLLRGYRADKPTLVQTGSVHRMRQVSSEKPADTVGSPDTAWAALFLGEGFDPVDGASRVNILGRARDSVYASAREGGQTLAVGAAAFGHGWASVHGMRTATACRGRGLAGRVLAGLAEASMSRGMARVFLQVEAGNTAAQALYRRAGFEAAWAYEYWRRA